MYQKQRRNALDGFIETCRRTQVKIFKLKPTSLFYNSFSKSYALWPVQTRVGPWGFFLQVFAAIKLLISHQNSQFKKLDQFNTC